jgi:quercetin dioxygenase-like cupin family protein
MPVVILGAIALAPDMTDGLNINTNDIKTLSDYLRENNKLTMQVTTTVTTKATIKAWHFVSSLLIVGLAAVPKISLAELKPETNLETNTYTQTVTREVLASGLPTGAEGRILELVKYTIPPYAQLPAHIHPGMQMERVEFGVLTYSVVEGTAEITRADGTKELLEAGETTLLKAGDSLVEPEGMVHFASNDTPSIVILMSSSLFEVDKPKAILVE